MSIFDLLTENTWIRFGAAASPANPVILDGTDPTATQWSLYGALERCYPESERAAVRSSIEERIRERYGTYLTLEDFNDYIAPDINSIRLILAEVETTSGGLTTCEGRTVLNITVPCPSNLFHPGQCCTDYIDETPSVCVKNDVKMRFIAHIGTDICYDSGWRPGGRHAAGSDPVFDAGSPWFESEGWYVTFPDVPDCVIGSPRDIIAGI